MDQRAFSVYADAIRELGVLTDLVTQPAMATASGATLERHIGDAQVGVMRLRGTDNLDGVLRLLRAGLRLYDAAQQQMLTHPHLATAHAEALCAGLVSALLERLFAAEPGLRWRAAEVEHDVCLRACLELRGLVAFRSDCLRRAGGPDKALDATIVSWARTHDSEVVSAAYRAGNEEWPQHGYPDPLRQESIRLLRTLDACAGAGEAKAVDTQVLYLRLMQSR